jgi:hypothetical protein
MPTYFRVPICESESEKRSLGKTTATTRFRMKGSHVSEGLPAVIRLIATVYGYRSAQNGVIV